MALVGRRSGLSTSLRGVEGVLGRGTSWDFFKGVEDTELVGRSLVGERERGSVDSGARYFLVEASRLGVVARGRRPASSLLDVDSGRRGVA
jgi:hypothetical protein